MQLVTRKALGWPASAAPLQPTAKGVKVHYTGGPVSTKLLKDHSLCIKLWQDIREAHLANVDEGYSDVAYNYAGCVHGYLLEGRGLGRRTGANGSQPLNKAHYAILGLIGSEGLTEPTDELFGAIRDGIELLSGHGSGDEIKGHKDGYATACPGGPLYAWVQKGAPRPKTGTPSAGSARPVVDLSNLVRAFKEYPKHEAVGSVKTVQEALAKERLYSGAIDGKAGSKTKAGYKQWQLRCGFSGKDADGLPGKSSVTKLGKRRGFDVKE